MFKEPGGGFPEELKDETVAENSQEKEYSPEELAKIGERVLERISEYEESIKYIESLHTDEKTEKYLLKRVNEDKHILESLLHSKKENFKLYIEEQKKNSHIL